MARKKIAEEETKTETEKEFVEVVFKNTYIGDLGTFYKKNKYSITKELAELLKNDVEE